MSEISKVAGGTCSTSHHRQSVDRFQPIPNLFGPPLTFLQLTTKATPLVFQPFIIAKSVKRPGIGDGVYNDITYADMTQKQIQDIGLNFLDDFVFTSSVVHFFNMRAMARTFFTSAFSSEMKDIVFNMIDTFEKNAGVTVQTYSNPALNNIVKNHISTKSFIEHIRETLKAQLKINRDPLVIKNKNLQLDFNRRPIFHETSDIAGGLSFAINDTWANDVKLLSFTDNGTTYTATIEVIIYDHFGLDIPDVSLDFKIYGHLRGFRSWFILQHWEKFGYKPLVTTINITETFTDNF